MHLEKASLRLELKRRLKESTPLLPISSGHLRELLLKHPFWQTASTVALFAALPSEPDLAPLCPFPGKRLVFPRIQPSLELGWFLVETPSIELIHETSHRFAIREPLSSLPRVPLHALDLIVTPGLAFTEKGHRLGRGGGFYDKVISFKSSHTRTLGVCFSFQVLDAIPCEAHDQSVDAIIHA